MVNHNARKLRQNQTDMEKKLWSHLRKRQLNNCRFRRQFPIGSYIVDFICLDARLIIELDGSQHYEPENMEYDQTRTTWLNSQNFTVLRFNNGEVFENIDGVLQTICFYLPAE